MFSAAAGRNVPIMDGVIHGECLCGEIAFEFREAKLHGLGHALGRPFVVAVPEQFRVTRGQELMAHYRGEGTTVRTFCRRCGSSLYTEEDLTYHVSAEVLGESTLAP